MRRYVPVSKAVSAPCQRPKTEEKVRLTGQMVWIKDGIAITNNQID
ncbi:hypothetical protein AB26_3214 [Escherichia coli 2-011-08_S1_C2]|nr:hypothetical protein AB26_3214 [Escherichia coli 2-011-08_S1_C2]